jgi:hypothetical protein
MLLGHPETQAIAAQEILVENYPYGKTHYKTEVDEHRQPHGWSREYTKAGILKAEHHYAHGVRDGISRLYYTTGELMTEWVYKNGTHHGPSLGYFINGRLKDKGMYQSDLLEGTVLKYYSGGAMKARMNFKPTCWKENPQSILKTGRYNTSTVISKDGYGRAKTTARRKTTWETGVFSIFAPTMNHPLHLCAIITPP